jgi:tetratricopeptide (TPR) repeat protein
MRADPPEYKPTIFDRLGPVAGIYMHAVAYAVLVFAMSVVGGFIMIAGGKLPSTLLSVVEVLFVALLFAIAVAVVSMFVTNAAGDTYAHLMVNGSTTPYREQYSYQQALVMQGRVDDAIESFEAIIEQQPSAVDARIKAAELYAREKGNAARAAALFRDAQRIPTIGIGEDVYVANRLVDLYNGPLGDPGRALVELRRLIDKYPRSAAAEHARDALAALKPVHLESTED